MKLKIKFLIGVIVIIVLILIYLVFEFNNKDIVIYVGDEKIILDYEDDNPIDLNSFNSEFDTIIKEKSLLHKIKVNGKFVNNQIDLGKVNIEKDKVLEVEVSYITGEKKQYKINILPSNFPSYTVKGKSEYEGDYYTSTYSFEYDKNHYIFKLDEEGKMLFYKKTNMVSFDFKKHFNSQGKVRYLYLEATANDFYGARSILPCHLVVLNEEYKEIDRITHFVSNKEEIKLENHGYIYIDDNHYILVGYKPIVDIYKRKEYNVYNCIIQEIKNDKVIWEFNSVDYKKIYEYSTLEDLDYSIEYQDYIHFNSMEIDKKDNNLLASFRNIDATLKISRTTGELMWILSGEGDEFHLADKQKTSKQHSVISVEDNKILLYDNGNKYKKSRVVEYTIDETNKKITNFKQYDLGLHAIMMGSVRVVDKEKNVYLLCYGGTNYQKSSIQEINMKTGEVYFEFTFDNSKSIYNVNKY